MPISDPATIVPHRTITPAAPVDRGTVAPGTLYGALRLSDLGHRAETERAQLAGDVARVQAARRGRAAAPLGIPAILPTTSPPASGAGFGEVVGKSGRSAAEKDERRRREAPDRIKRRFELQDTARAILAGGPTGGRPAASVCLPAGELARRPGRREYRGRPPERPRLHRIHHCQVTPAGGLVAVNYHAEHGSASYGGLQTCGSMWACPVCAAKIGARRAAEVADGAAAWRRRDGHLYMLTLTFQHNAGMGLAQSLDVVKQAYEMVCSGRMWSLFCNRVGLIGSIVAREITHGANGWHPHLHILLFTNQDMGKQRYVNEQWIAKRWQFMLSKLGAHADLEHGTDLRRADDKAGEYVAKLAGAWSIAPEVAGAWSKQGRGESRTAPQLLHDAGRPRQIGREAADLAGALYAEYVAATVGVKWLYWSKGLRAYCGLAAEQTDDELAAEQTAEATNLLVLTPAEWRFVRGNSLRGELLARACGGDAEYVAGWLMLQGLTIPREQLRKEPEYCEKPPKKPYPI